MRPLSPEYAKITNDLMRQLSEMSKDKYEIYIRKCREGSRPEQNDISTGPSSISCRPDIDHFIAAQHAKIIIDPNIKAPAYSLKTDAITMRSIRDDFRDSYVTMLHELVHWTGPRLHRLGSFVDSEEEYTGEEAVAELGTAFLAHDFKLGFDLLALRHAPYLFGYFYNIDWSPCNLIPAAYFAQDAVDYLYAQERKEIV